MGLINPAPGVVDFGGFRALQPLYDAAKAAGIWIVLRPGDFIFFFGGVVFSNVDSNILKDLSVSLLHFRAITFQTINRSFLSSPSSISMPKLLQGVSLIGSRRK
jgi:hypothetical protein